MKNNKNFIKPLSYFSGKVKKNCKNKVNLVLKKEQMLQIQFPFSVNNFELLFSQIDRDILLGKIVKGEAAFVEKYNKEKP